MRKLGRGGIDGWDYDPDGCAADCGEDTLWNGWRRSRMNMKDFMAGFEIDDTGLVTEEAKRALQATADRITLEAKANLERELSDIKELEKNKLCRDRAEAVARSLAAYKEAGLTDEQAWELAKQEAMIIPYRLGCSV